MHRPRLPHVAWALAAVLFAASFGFFAAFRSYVELNRLRLDPSETGTTVRTLPRADKRVLVLLGDSRVAQWPAPHSDLFLCVNRGISGQTTAQILGRFDVHVRTIAPDAVVIQAGSNDLKCIPLFPERAAEIESTCIENIRQIVARSVECGATVVLTTIFPHGPIPLYRRPFFDARVTEATRRVNEALKRMAESPRVVVLDTWPILAGADGLVRPEYRRELLHVSSDAYRVLNTHLEAILHDHLPVREPSVPHAKLSGDHVP